MAQKTTNAGFPDVAGVVNCSEAAIYAEDAVAGSGTATVAILDIPAGSRVLRGAVHVEELFNGGSTNVLIVGDEDTDNLFIAAGDLNEGATGYTAFVSSGAPKKYTAAKQLRIKYTYTGTAPTTGRARVYVEWVRLSV